MAKNIHCFTKLKQKTLGKLCSILSKYDYFLIGMASTDATVNKKA